MDSKQRFPQGQTERLISESRKNLQNPYAYLGPSGQFEAQLISASDCGSKDGRQYTGEEIAVMVRKLQREFWLRRKTCWPHEQLDDPVRFLDPCKFLQALGYKTTNEPLGRMRTVQGMVDVAGTIDKEKKEVRLADTLESGVRRFTAAHELGHALLHDQVGMHRDRPLDGTQAGSKSAIEIEADYFAVLFIMPEKLVRREFFIRFRCERFEATEDNLFFLSQSGYLELKSNRRALSRQLASKIVNVDNCTFTSLSERFGVSIEAMAIRLEQIGIV